MSNNFKINQDIWTNNINDLFKKKYLLQFFPSKKYNIKENINSIVRLSLYSSIVLSILYKDISYAMIFIATVIMTYIYYIINKKTIREHLKTDMMHNKIFVKEIKSKPYNPLANKLIGESNNQYNDTYLVSDNKEITNNILYKYDTLKKGITKQFDTMDMLNEKETMLNFYPLTDKTGIPNFAKFAKNVYGTAVEDRRELVNRGFVSKADKARLQIFEESLNYDPANIKVNYLQEAAKAI
tara:strand:- start:1492 stop:2211 length:720 start_codon:yes stop_codon:yes gene_type:complete